MLIVETEWKAIQCLFAVKTELPGIEPAAITIESMERNKQYAVLYCNLLNRI
ncbi:hypothetical protein [Thermotalea metallivorans]|nr:hypothetical protein [Thermotalea metallivorans]